MAKLYKTTVSLRFMGGGLNPTEITKNLGTPPTASELKGDRISIGKNGQYRIAEMGAWRIETDFNFTGNLDTQISSLFFNMTKDMAIWKRISQLYSGNLFIGLFLKNYNEGISISSTAINCISGRGLKLDFDIYSAYLEAISDDEIF